MRGFWAKQWWEVWGQKGTKGNRSPSQTKMITLIWKHQMELWREICSDSHQAGSENENRKELEAHMRHLHAREIETQAEDRMYLFHPDVEEYVKTATMAQMAAWINQNEEAIKASIKRAQ